MIEINKLHFISLFGLNSDMILLAAEYSASQSSSEWKVGWLTGWLMMWWKLGCDSRNGDFQGGILIEGIEFVNFRLSIKFQFQLKMGYKILYSGVWIVVYRSVCM